ncbi:hypothetical protein As57867_005223, partial [Aphanomyces stellatus]
MRLPILVGLPCFVAAAYLDYPSYTVPVFDLNTMASPDSTSAMIHALETTGLVAIQGIPGFASLRQRYFQAAVQCTLKTTELSALQQKSLVDGTLRRTFSIPLAGLSQTIAQRCPEYTTVHRAYTTVVDEVAKAFAAVVDASHGNIDDGVQLLAPIVDHGDHLDHFHAYTKPSSAQANAGVELSLDLHADAGLLILFPKAQFWTVDSIGNALPVADEDGGLVLELGPSSLVRPVLHSDALHIMAGEGLRHWANFGVRFHAAVHGLAMPSSLDSSIVRAFAGRMLLFPSDQRMANTGMTYGAYANATTRSLQDGGMSDVSLSFACPHGRMLVASDSICTHKVYTAASPSTCEKECNTQGSSCPSTCKVEHSMDGTTCWMMCVRNLECSYGNVCVNSNSQSVMCATAPVTTPKTTVPITTPSTTVPKTTAPVTPSPPISTSPPITTTTPPPPPTTTPPPPTTTTPPPITTTTTAPTTTLPSTTVTPPTTSSTSPSPTTIAPTPSPTVTTSIPAAPVSNQAQNPNESSTNWTLIGGLGGGGLVLALGGVCFVLSRRNRPAKDVPVDDSAPYY